MPKLVTVQIAVPDEATDTEVNQWVEGTADELKDSGEEGKRWVITGHKIGTPDKAQQAAFLAGQKDEEEEEDEDDDD